MDLWEDRLKDAYFDLGFKAGRNEGRATLTGNPDYMMGYDLGKRLTQSERGLI